MSSPALTEVITSKLPAGEARGSLRQLAEAHLPLSGTDPLFQRQAFWSTQVHNETRKSLLAEVTARDRSRLLCLTEPFSSAWLTPIPSHALGLTFSSLEFRCLLRWRLGLPLNPALLSMPPCAACGEAQDRFGDHTVCCCMSNPYQRHQLVADALARVLRAAGLQVLREVAIQGKLRPADLLLRGLEALRRERQPPADTV